MAYLEKYPIKLSVAAGCVRKQDMANQLRLRARKFRDKLGVFFDSDPNLKELYQPYQNAKEVPLFLAEIIVKGIYEEVNSRVEFYDADFMPGE
jgi:hypothetical protein